MDFTVKNIHFKDNAKKCQLQLGFLTECVYLRF